MNEQDVLDETIHRLYQLLEQERLIMKDNETVANVLLSLERQIHVLKAEIRKKIDYENSQVKDCHISFSLKRCNVSMVKQ